MIVASVNLCHYSDKQLPLYVAFLVRVRPDVTFCQEANGCLPALVRALRRCDVHFAAASYDPCTHVVLRRGHFMPAPISPRFGWPQSSFFVRAWTPYLGVCALVNVHLCERQWTSACPDDHVRFRVDPIRRIWDVVRRLAMPVIMGGDFNCFSHLDAAYHDPVGTCAHIFALPQCAFTSRFLRQNDMVDCLVGAPTHTWPVPLSDIAWSGVLQSEIDPSEPGGRISRIYVSAKHAACTSYAVHANEPWFSDHRAVVVTLQPHASPPPSSMVTPLNHRHKQASVALCSFIVLIVVLRGRRPTWHMMAHGLVGERNSYIELSQDASGSTLGFFYVDGLMQTSRIELRTSVTIHTTQIGTFDPDACIPPDKTIHAALYNEAQEIVLPVDVYRIDESSEDDT